MHVYFDCILYMKRTTIQNKSSLQPATISWSNQICFDRKIRNRKKFLILILFVVKNTLHQRGDLYIDSLKMKKLRNVIIGDLTFASITILLLIRFDYINNLYVPSLSVLYFYIQAIQNVSFFGKFNFRDSCFKTFMILVPFKSGETSDLVLNWNPTRLGF